MKNITVSVPEDVYRAARIHAAERGTSVSGLVSEHLRAIAGRDDEFERLEAQQRGVQEEIARFSAADRVDRDAVHGRAVR